MCKFFIRTFCLLLLSYQVQSAQSSMDAVVEGLESPWDMVFLSEQEILVTEKPGQLLRINLDSGDKVAISGMPEVVYKGQGGLLGIVLHPDFAENQLLYLSYSTPVKKKKYTTRLLRARLENNALKDVEILFTAMPARSGGRHYGGAMVFDQAGYLYLGVGDRGDRHQAQELDSDLGKIHRFNDDGSIPESNPFVDQRNANDSIFSWGHRNPQGLDIHPLTGDVWEAEHGPKGGDEVNRLQAGANYGWPVITYGEEYRGGKIGEGTEKAGMEQPVHYYVPSIGTAGIAFYTGDLIEEWKNDLFVGGLVYVRTRVSRLTLKDSKVVDDEALFDELNERVRNLASGPDGKLYVLTESGVIHAVSAATQ